MAHRKTGNVRLAPDGKMMRDASFPGGTLVGTQTYGDTPEKKHKAWLLNIQEDARAAAGHRKLNSQAVKNARKKAKREEKNRRASPCGLRRWRGMAAATRNGDSGIPTRTAS